MTRSHINERQPCLGGCDGDTDDPYGGPCSECTAAYDDEDQADAFTWLDCDNPDNPDCNCRRRPTETVHLPAEDVTR